VLNLSEGPTEILVVDSSDTDETEKICREMLEVAGLENLVYVRSAKGLTIQRNVGLALVQKRFDIVHFIDDDVLLDPKYIEELNKAFDSNPAAIGLSGMVLGGDRRPPRLTARMALRDSKIPGKVLASGYNVGAHETTAGCFVDWLPGCSMSFRLDSINGLTFDENRSGYALGEDVDFGLKASTRGKLRHVPEAKLVHKLSPVNRLDIIRLAEMGVRHRWQLATDFPWKVKKAAVVYASLNTSSSRLIKSLVQRNPTLFRCAFVEVVTLAKCIVGLK
jgi:GT2 family glycosyltransferase